MDEDNIFQKRLKEARETAKLSQAKLAEAADVTPATISSYENTEKSPSVAIAKRMAQVLDVSIDWLCGNESITASTMSAFFALITVLKKFKPRIEFEEQTKDGISKTAAKLIFDDGLFEVLCGDFLFGSIIPEEITNFFKEYSNIQTVKNMQLLSSEQIENLETDLLKKYKHLPDLPVYEPVQKGEDQNGNNPKT